MPLASDPSQLRGNTPYPALRFLIVACNLLGGLAIAFLILAVVALLSHAEDFEAVHLLGGIGLAVVALGIASALQVFVDIEQHAREQKELSREFLRVLGSNTRADTSATHSCSSPRASVQ